jgi:membrane protein DedA with SNARE-associated domain
VSDLLNSLLHLPAAAVYGVIGALAAAENVFPPLPADSAVALGAFLSAGGRVSALAVFGITWTANLAGAIAVYAAARTAGRSFFKGPIGRRLLKPAALSRLERLHDKYGTWGIFLSRFVPGVRAVVPPFAGIANVGVVRALVPMAVASAIWYGALTLVAATLVQNLDQIAAFTRGLGRVSVVLVALVAVVVGMLLIARRRRHRDAPRG